MRILIHGINHAPEKIGIGKYTGEMAEWLARQGHQVKVITAPPYYPEWQVQKPYSAWLYKRERLNGVTVLRCPLWVPRRPGGLKRILHLASFALTSLPISLGQIFWRPDVVIAVEPPIFGAVVARLTAMLCRSRAWLHIQDFEIDAAAGLGMVKGNALLRAAFWLERWLTRGFDRVSSISHAMLQRVGSKGVATNRVFFLPNWVDTSQVQPLPPGVSMRELWGIAEQNKVVLYSGNLGRKQGLDLLLRVAASFKLSRPDVLFVIVGEGAARTELQQIAADSGLTNVMFKPLQPVEMLGKLLATADIHAVLQKRGAADLVMPSKLTSILAAGGVVLVTADKGTELANVVSENDLGLVVEPESESELEQALSRLLEDEAARARLGGNARRYACEHLDTVSILARLEKELTSLTREYKQ